MKRHLTLLICCITILVSCSKDDKIPVIQDGNYFNNGLTTASPIILYVGNKSITDRNLYMRWYFSMAVVTMIYQLLLPVILKALP